MGKADRVMKEAALVTGASSGIGRELADHCARNGRDLVLVARSRDRQMAELGRAELTAGLRRRAPVLTG